jgi:hypothetical protein
MEIISIIGLHSLRGLWVPNHIIVKMEIYNTCSDVELVDPLYFSDGVVRCNPLDQKVAPGGTLSAAFKINHSQLISEGTLMCRLRKKESNFDRQFDTDTTNIDENGLRRVQLLVGWKLEYFSELRVYMLLMEHGEKLAWTKDRLKEQHNEFRGRLSAHNDSVESAWLMEDGTVLKLTLDGVGNREHGIKITISEVQRKDYATVPIWLEPKV